MSVLKVIAPTVGEVISLDRHELGWAVLDFLKQGRKAKELSGNTMRALVGIYEPPLHVRSTQHPREMSELPRAFAEALDWLVTNGLVTIEYEDNYTFHVPTRRGDEIETAKAFKTFLRETYLHQNALHERIRREAWPLYIRGKFDTAVFEAFKQVEVAVRHAAGFSNSEYGVKLMRRAFDAEKGLLSDKSLPITEREAIAHLFAGSIGAFKNPNSHREVGIDDPAKAAEALMLASHLMRIVDETDPAGATESIE